MGEKYYIFVGCAEGRFDAQDAQGNDIKKDYFNMYVISPVSDYVSDDYRAVGYKAEKLSCVSKKVWENLTVGECVNLYFTDKKAVAMAASTGNIVSLEA